MLRFLTILLSFLLIAGCQTFQKTEAVRTDIGEIYSIEPQIAWRRADREGIEIWTIDGPMLQQIRFLKSIGDGDPILLSNRKVAEKKPRFSSKMSANEIMEIVVASLDNGKRGQIKATNLRPMKFGSVQGFRFDLTWVSAKGLPYSAIVAAGGIAGSLELIFYTGDSLHHFAKFEDTVEKILKSIQIKKA